MAFKGRVEQDNIDYKSLNGTLIDSGINKENPALYQVIKSLINGAQTSKDFINKKFNKGDDLETSLLKGIVDPNNGGVLTDFYTPIKTLGLNLLSLGSNELYYYRHGSVIQLVTVFGYLTINPTAIGLDTTGWLSLPIKSYFDSFWELAGVGYSDTVNQGITFQADPLNRQAKLRFLSTVMGQADYFFSFSYRIISQ